MEEIFSKQGFEHPHIIQFLWDRYKEKLEETIKKRGAAVSIEDAVDRVNVKDFIKFASEYLAKNRPVRTTFIDDNIGIVLSNNKTIQVSPGKAVRGTMQTSTAVEITRPLDDELDVTKQSHVDI